MKFLIFTVFFLSLLIFSCEKQMTVSKANKYESKTVQSIHEKIKTYQIPTRIEVRNYVKDQNNKYQADIMAIKKIKTRLDPKSKVYLELNLFVNESDTKAPLIAQFMLFDVKTKNLIQEENLNLD